MSTFLLHTSRLRCALGSSLYQQVTQDCATKDPSYNGDWYCATMEVSHSVNSCICWLLSTLLNCCPLRPLQICESFKNKHRECIQTRGCATFEECQSTTSTSGIYNGNTVQVTSGVNPAGMTITATCCKAHDFPTDDAIAIDYSEICNSAPGSAIALSYTTLAALLATALYLLQA